MPPRPDDHGNDPRKRKSIADTCLDVAWRCKRCQYVLGFGTDVKGKTHLRVKIGDEFVHILEPEQVIRECKRCGHLNVADREPGKSGVGVVPHGGAQ